MAINEFIKASIFLILAFEICPQAHVTEKNKVQIEIAILVFMLFKVNLDLVLPNGLPAEAAAAKRAELHRQDKTIS
jgi:hypothetical protein